TLYDSEELIEWLSIELRPYLDRKEREEAEAERQANLAALRRSKFFDAGLSAVLGATLGGAVVGIAGAHPPAAYGQWFAYSVVIGAVVYAVVRRGVHRARTFPERHTSTMGVSTKQQQPERALEPTRLTRMRGWVFRLCGGVLPRSSGHFKEAR
ncbi:MAG TPA: hypothetical protein VFA48_05450, partial [Gammaproteobacteria bacterium]|nr:hypothetical protein [Gammaproteobacteria bacterium]